MAHLSFRAAAALPSDRVSRALAAYVLLVGAAAAMAVLMIVREPDLATEAAPVPLPMVFLEDAEPEPDAQALTERDALARRARAGDSDAELTLGRLLARDARHQHDLGRVSDAALWLDRARGHGRTEAALDLAELADRYCSRHELLADRLCAGD